jgi:gas vesicle protein
MSEPINDEMESTDSAESSNLAWFLVGLVIGATAAVLYAPKSGKDTREFLSRKTQESREAVESTGRDVIERSKDMYEKGRQLVEDAADLFERGRKLVRG